MASRTASIQVLSNSHSRRVTRNTVRRMRCTFDFLNLSSELRNAIYELSVEDLDGIIGFFDKYYARLLKEVKKEGPKRHLPVPHKKTPTVLLICKQIYEEAVGYLSLCSVVFNHGLFSLSDVRKVISPNVIRHVSSIIISDAGHPIIQGEILPESWHGYIRLITQLSTILSAGHNLQKFTLEFNDLRLKEHMTHCFNSQHDCGFRDGLRDAADQLRNIRGVAEVVIKGINPEQAREIKESMEST